MPGVTLPQDGHLVVLGQTGLGKTAFVRAWLRQTSPQVYSRILVADKDAEYGAVAVGITTLEELAAYVEQIAPPWRIAYQGDDLDAAMPVLCEATYQIAGGMLLIAEEADLWATPSAIIPELAHVLKYGRKKGAHLCCVARRASELHRLCTSQARHIVAFGTVEPIDVEYLRRAVSGPFADRVQQLEPLEGAWWDRRAREVITLRVDPAQLQLRRLDRQEPLA